MELNFIQCFRKELILKTAIKCKNMGVWGNFSGPEGAGTFFLPLRTRCFDIFFGPEGGGLG